MPDYQLGKIYKITGINKDGIELIYIGSTCQLLCMRLGGHKRDLRCSSKIIFETCSNILITLIELCPCNSKEELISKERSFYDKYDCVNVNKPFLYEGERELYYQENKAQLLEYQQKYYEENKKKAAETKAKWYQNKKKMIICICGSISRDDGIKAHEQSKKHIKYLEQKK